MSDELKGRVHEFWNTAACGEKLYLKGSDREAFEAQRKARYELEPIPEFADFSAFRGLRTLEIGVGLGADHQSLAESGADLYGVDLTERAVDFTRARLALFGLKSELAVADAEHLPFADDSFDAVYSWGVLHHTPDTPRACKEVLRVLRLGGKAKIMIYHKHSLVGLMLWLRYGLGVGRPWRSLDYIYHHYLESPGTKAYTYRAARQLFAGARELEMSSPVGHADLLESAAGQRHGGVVLSLARRFWPRWCFRRFTPQAGLGLMITLKK